MSIVPVTVPVPASGDGPIVDVSALVGPKTVQLSGQFEGYYVLLASQDDASFVGVASFDASSPVGLKVTFSGAVKSVRLRAVAASVGSVTCEVSGVSAPGENGFGVLASLTSGFTGLTPVVDLATVVAPTGPEEDSCFLCRGAFQGSIVVLGSVDGTRYEPVGEFKVDRIPEGASPVVELAPLVTETKIRYARLQVVGTTTGTVVVTAGGRVPSSGGTTGQAVAVVTSGTGGGTGYLVLGTPSTTDPLADSLGNLVTTVYPSDCSCLGQKNRVTLNGGPVVVVGSDNTVGGVRSLVLAHHSELGAFADRCVLLGNDLSVTSTQDTQSYVVLVGHDLVQTNASSQTSILIGGNITAGTSSGTSTYANVLMGDTFRVGNNAFGNLVVAPQGGTFDLADSSHNVVLGTNNTVGNQMFGSSCVGYHDVVGDNEFLVSLLGTYANVGSNGSLLVVAGHQIAVGAGATSVFAFGDNITVGAGLSNVVALGSTLNVAGSNILVAGSSGKPLHTVTFKGFHGSAVDTLTAVDGPASDGDVGLYVTVNQSGTVTSKQLHAAVPGAVPVGALLLYITP